MGDLLSASCPCGFYVENMFFAIGPSHPSFFGYPAVCTSCEVFDAFNIQEENPRCPECGAAVVFYNNPSLNLSRKSTPFRVTERSDWDHHSKFLLNHLFKCPDCGKYTMKFEWVGLWD